MPVLNQTIILNTQIIKTNWNVVLRVFKVEELPISHGYLPEKLWLTLK